jgi:hypothetical protein
MSVTLVPETWKLPPENDDRDKKILKLEEELRSISVLDHPCRWSLCLSTVHRQGLCI